MPDHVALKYRQRFASANYRLREAPLRQNFEAIEAVFSNPAIRLQFTPAELNHRRRLAEIDAFWAGARNEYVRNRGFGFVRHLIVGALCYPDSVLRPRRSPFVSSRPAAAPSASAAGSEKLVIQGGVGIDIDHGYKARQWRKLRDP